MVMLAVIATAGFCGGNVENRIAKLSADAEFGFGAIVDVPDQFADELNIALLPIWIGERENATLNQVLKEKIRADRLPPGRIHMLFNLDIRWRNGDPYDDPDNPITVYLFGLPTSDKAGIRGEPAPNLFYYDPDGKNDPNPWKPHNDVAQNRPTFGANARESELTVVDQFLGIYKFEVTTWPVDDLLILVDG